MIKSWRLACLIRNTLYTQIQDDQKVCAPHDYSTEIRCTETFWSLCSSLWRFEWLLREAYLEVLSVSIVASFRFCRQYAHSYFSNINWYVVE